MILACNGIVHGSGKWPEAEGEHLVGCTSFVMRQWSEGSKESQAIAKNSE